VHGFAHLQAYSENHPQGSDLKLANARESVSVMSVSGHNAMENEACLGSRGDHCEK